MRWRGERQSSNVGSTSSWDDIIASVLYPMPGTLRAEDEKHEYPMAFNPTDLKTIDELPQPSNAPDTTTGRMLNEMDRQYRDVMTNQLNTDPEVTARQMKLAEDKAYWDDFREKEIKSIMTRSPDVTYEKAASIVDKVLVEGGYRK